VAIDISAQITANWPKTEAKLDGDSEVAYSTQKAKAIARAKIDVYGSEADVPASIPDKVATWIADRATIYLIPLAKEHYAIERTRSTSKQGATTAHYDLLAMLDALRAELEEACALAHDEVMALAGAWSESDTVPAVSTDGMLIDPVARAVRRGLF
jgi:hypothetical protein